MLRIRQQTLNCGYFANAKLFHSAPEIDTNSHQHEKFNVHQLAKNVVGNSALADYNFARDNFNRVVVYTDGCCLNNNVVETPNRQAGIGIFWDKNHHLNISAPVLDRHLTNNRAEVLAAHTAVAIAKHLRLKTLCVRSDSMYVVDACNDWILRWQAHSWMNKKNVLVKNTDLWKPFSHDMRGVFTSFVKVDESDPGLKSAHELANVGAIKKS